jgi:hypothetical protein
MLDPLVVLEALAAPDIKITVVGHRFSRKKERERERERERASVANFYLYQASTLKTKQNSIY